MLTEMKTTLIDAFSDRLHKLKDHEIYAMYSCYLEDLSKQDEVTTNEA